MSSDPTAKVTSSTDTLVATLEERRLSLMFVRNENSLVMSIRGNPRTACSMYIDKEIATKLTRWLQARIAEM
jgi:hypothetical protein